VKKRTENTLCIVLSCIVITTAIIGLFYSDGGETIFVKNIYGQEVELYGKGIYAYNSLLTVSGRLGADWMGILCGILMISLCFLKKDQIWAILLKISQSFLFVYYFACLVFSISMNRLYLLYVLGFGLSIFLSFVLVVNDLKTIVVKESSKKCKNLGISLCLGISGVVTIGIWLSMIVPYMITDNYGYLLGVLTTESTYAIDLGVLCPAMIICAILVQNKRDFGYKMAPILLYILFCVGPMVILQNIYCLILGISVPIPAFIGTVLSFVVMCIFALVFLVKSIRLFEKVDR
jgi:hypothetical protein